MVGLGMGLGWIFWVVIIGGAIWLISRQFNTGATNQSTHQRANQTETPRDILKKRYARGEITEDEFKEMKRNL